MAFEITKQELTKRANDLARLFKQTRDKKYREQEIRLRKIIEDLDSGSASSVSTYIHNQSSASSSWTINHNLDKYPSVTVVDSGDNKVIGAVEYTSRNTVVISFCATFSGKAYLN